MEEVEIVECGFFIFFKDLRLKIGEFFKEYFLRTLYPQIVNYVESRTIQKWVFNGIHSKNLELFYTKKKKQTSKTIIVEFTCFLKNLLLYVS